MGANRVTRIWNAKPWSEKTGGNMHQERMKSLTRKVRL